jgi:hypothetical protein
LHSEFKGINLNTGPLLMPIGGRGLSSVCREKALNAREVVW